MHPEQMGQAYDKSLRGFFASARAGNHPIGNVETIGHDFFMKIC